MKEYIDNKEKQITIKIKIKKKINLDKKNILKVLIKV